MSKSTTTTPASDLPPNPNHLAKWTEDPSDKASARGFQVNGIDNTPGPKAYYIQLEARPGKEEDLARFLLDINAGVDKEPLTGPWFALRYSKTTFAIFEAFPHAQGRHDHDNGPGGYNFTHRPEELKEFLAYPAQIFRLDVLHGKFGVVLGKENENPPVVKGGVLEGSKL